MIPPRLTLLSLPLLASLLLPGTCWGGPVTITAVGDIMLAGADSTTLRERGFDYPFAATRHELAKGDLVVGNLEAPIATGGVEFRAKRFRFRTDPKVARALKQAGFSVVTLANNHIMDFGPSALQETLSLLDRNGIRHVGAGMNLNAARRETVLSANGSRVAFLAYSLTLPTEFYATPATPGTVPGWPRFFREDIARARQAADYVVVSFHWGSEGATLPHPYQIETAHAAIDAGATVVIGHHPHVLQGVERYGDGIILYSLGNFAFNTTSRLSDRSVIARITLDGGVKEVELVPLNVLNREVSFQPRVLRGKRGEDVIAHLNRLSEGLRTAFRSDGGRYLLDLGENRRLAKK